MIIRKLNIRGWRCFFCFALDRYNADVILSRLEELEAPPSILRRVRRNIRLDRMDTGFTYSNLFLRESVIVIGRSSSGAEFLNSFVHELRHLADDIAFVYGYALRGEEVAYLTGDIALALSDVVCAMSCEVCRKDGISSL